jgi:hypothetical protein
LKEEALDSTVWTTRFGRGYAPVVRQTRWWWWWWGWRDLKHAWKDEILCTQYMSGILRGKYLALDINM